MSSGLTLPPSCPGMARRIELCVHISELADLLVQCRKGRYSPMMYASAKLGMITLCRQLLDATVRMPSA